MPTSPCCPYGGCSEPGKGGEAPPQLSDTSKGRGPGGREELNSLELIKVQTPAAGQEELPALYPL